MFKYIKILGFTHEYCLACGSLRRSETGKFGVGISGKSRDCENRRYQIN